MGVIEVPITVPKSTCPSGRCVSSPGGGRHSGYAGDLAVVRAAGRRRLGLTGRRQLVVVERGRRGGVQGAGRDVWRPGRGDQPGDGQKRRSDKSHMKRHGRRVGRGADEAAYDERACRR